MLNLGFETSRILMTPAGSCDPDTSMANLSPSTSASQVLRSGGANFGGQKIAGIPEFTNFQGQLQISALVQNNENRSVMLQTMRGDGKMVEETIMRLPQSSTLEKSYSTLVSASSHKNLRLVLNMAIQDTYSVEPEVDLKLPAVLDRQKVSIPRTIYTPQQRIGPSCTLGKRALGDTSDGVVLGEEKASKEKNGASTSFTKRKKMEGKEDLKRRRLGGDME
jgi:hypothetical protein